MTVVCGNRTRFSEIDILKGISIILMVGAHGGALFGGFVSLFHMAVFFMASGFCYREKCAETAVAVKNNIIRKIRSLWVPFFCWNAVFVLFRNVLIRINIYTDNPAIEQYGGHVTEAYSLLDMLKRIAAGALFSYKEEIIGAMWFLKILFLLTITFCGFDFIIKKLAKGNRKYRLLAHSFVSILFLAFGYWGSVNHIELYGLSYIGSYYILYFLGYFFSLTREQYRRWPWFVWIFIALASYGTLKWLQPRGGIGINRNSYTSPLFLLAASISGWWLLYSISTLIERLPYLKTGFAFIGQHGLPVVIFHFLAFRLVALIVVALNGLPSFCLAIFPRLKSEEGWWIAYTIAGTMIPILGSLISNRLLRKIPVPRGR